MELPESNTVEQELAFYEYALKNLQEGHWSEFLCHHAADYYNLHSWSDFTLPMLKRLFPEVCKYAVKPSGSVLWTAKEGSNGYTLRKMRIKALKQAIKSINLKLKKA